MPSLQFKGKTFVQNHHLAVKYHQLIPRKELSLTDKVSLHDNLIIQGDNLKALKALLPTYSGKVKCIYIDPPYNTGKEGWVYNDNVNSPMLQDWFRSNLPVDKEDMTRHDKWLCMIMPRLKLLRELLAEDGVIFISIDDNELYSLKILLDEIFTETNWVGTIIWKNVTDNNPSNIAIEHEYIICYAKNKEILDPIWKSKISDAKEQLIEIGKRLNVDYENQDDLQAAYTKWFRENKMFLGQLDRYKYIDCGGVYTGSQSVHNPGREGYRYDVIHPITKQATKQPLMGYRFPEATLNDLLESGKILFGEDENKIIELKVYAEEYEDKLASVVQLDGRLGSYDLKEIFPESKKSFDNPKPVQLIQQILSYLTNNDDIILDSFSGSGTTAHAVLELNKEDGGNRKFILIEQMDYADTTTAERVRRVIKGIETSKNESLKEGLGGTFSYFELGEPIEMESILRGENLPTYNEFARFIYYTATGEEFDESVVNEAINYIGETKNCEVYMFYKPDIEWLKRNALTLDDIGALPKYKGKQRVIFAPAKYVDDNTCLENRIDFCQLPYEIYRIQQ
ncbi:MAG TPA: site-specific DNA-methyltransferase [Mucilaginibacter sp.]|jgi:adenine-specific DNA-methyltransferase|nr:site-specific DNA-methyltransferase [Mucilaginibacter sp.]